MIRPVLIWPNVQLDSSCESVNEVHLANLRTGEKCWLRTLMTDLVETLAHFGGASLSAPQIGELSTVIALRVKQVEDPTKNIEEIIPIVNPSLKRVGQSRLIAEEHCLSFPGHTVKIARPRDVALVGIGLDGNVIEVESDDALAISIQHEMDHLAGTVLTDYESHLKRDIVRAKLAKLKLRGLRYDVPPERQPI